MRNSAESSRSFSRMWIRTREPLQFALSWKTQATDYVREVRQVLPSRRSRKTYHFLEMPRSAMSNKKCLPKHAFWQFPKVQLLTRAIDELSTERSRQVFMKR